MRVIILFLFLFSCAKTPLQTVEIDKNYKRDIYIYSDFGEGNGVLVLPKKDTYELTFFTPVDMDIFTFVTCSREITLEKKKTKVTTTYTPNEIEKTPACSAEIRAADTSNTFAWGFIDFEDSQTNMPAQLICGEKVIDAKGVSICQGRVGLKERIRFKNEMFVIPGKNCAGIKSENPDTPDQGSVFDFSISSGFCSYLFVEAKNAVNMHRLTTYGYTDVLIRK